MIFNPADGFVRAVVDVRGIRPDLPLLRGVGEIAVFGAGRDADIAIALRFLHCLPGPFPREHVVGLAPAAQQVHRHLRELQLVILRDGEQLAQVAPGVGGDADEFLAAMAHLHHAHAGAVPVEHLVAGARQHLGGKHCRPGAEIEDARHQCTVGPEGAGGSSAAASPSPPLPLPSSSRSSIRSRPASFSPSLREISVTPCVDRPCSRICDTLVRIRTPPVEISITSSCSSTSTAPTTLPLRSEVWIAITPWPPRPWRGYSPIGVRLPNPCSVAVSTDFDSSCAASMHTTRCPLPRRMPRTPVAWRPIGRTSPSSKRTALPSDW